jgi:hypothetical protein
MKKRLLADVLWEAANRWLATGPTSFHEAPLEYSCNAAIAAENHGRDTREAIYETHAGRRKSSAMRFLGDLGCDAHHARPWGSLRIASARIQGVRYMWLLLAMHVAEDEGLTV